MADVLEMLGEVLVEHEHEAEDNLGLVEDLFVEIRVRNRRTEIVESGVNSRDGVCRACAGRG